MQYHITKTYSETVKIGDSYKKYSTTLSKNIDPKSADDLEKESNKLFDQARLLTERDVKRDLGQ